MANHKSAKKRAKQTVAKTLRNKMKRTESRTYIKSLRAAIAENNKTLAEQLLVKVQGNLASLNKHGVMKANTVSRVTSRLATQVAKL